MDLILLNIIFIMKYKSLLYFFLVFMLLNGITFLNILVNSKNFTSNGKRLLLSFYISLYCIITLRGFSGWWMCFPLKSIPYKLLFTMNHYSNASFIFIIVVLLVGLGIDYSNKTEDELIWTSWLALAGSFVLLIVVVLEFYIKPAVYECDFELYTNDSKHKFIIKFYLIAIIFIVFNLKSN